mgnify:CR=1 FL=1
MREVKSISEEDHRRSDIKGNPSKGGTDHRKVKIRFVYNDTGCNGKDYKRNQENHSTKGRRSTVKL